MQRDAGNPAEDCCSEKHSTVHPASAGTAAWTDPSSHANLLGIVPHPHLHTIQPEMLDPLSSRFHCSSESTQCELTYTDYLMEPQLSRYDLTGPVPGPSASSHDSSVSASWFTHEPMLCSMMPVDLHSPGAGDHQEFQEGLTEVTSHMTQPVVCNASGGGQVLLVDPCEQRPVFLNLESAPTHRDDGLPQGKDVSVVGAPSQFPWHHQKSCPMYESRGQAANMLLQAPPARTVGTLCQSKSRKPCHCTKSQCLKLYCECFANGVMCSNCNCSNCHNNTQNEIKRHKAVKSYLGRNPDVFRSKIAGGNSEEVKGWHNKGCNCKRSGCLKKYCECFEANIACTSSCKCVGCRNYHERSQMDLKEKTVNVKDKWPVSVITPHVVEAVCGCLLAQAEKAERDDHSPAQAEQMVLEEFGHCLSQIVKTLFK